MFLALEIIIKTICWINGIISQVAVSDASLNTNSGKKNNQGQIESKGRYTQNCLFDLNGNLIKEISAKEF